MGGAYEAGISGKKGAGEPKIQYLLREIYVDATGKQESVNELPGESCDHA